VTAPKIGPGVTSSEPRIAASGRVRRDGCRTSSPPWPSSRRSRSRVDDLWQIQCVDDRCRRPFFLCRRCDRGHHYCPDCRHDAARAARRHATQREHWRKPSAKKKTSARTRRWRGQQSKIETDMGSRKLSPTPMVSVAEHSVAMEAAVLHREETPHGIDLDGHLAGPSDDASRGSRRAARRGFEGTIAQGDPDRNQPPTSESRSHVARRTSALRSATSRRAAEGSALPFGSGLLRAPHRATTAHVAVERSVLLGAGAPCDRGGHIGLESSGRGVSGGTPLHARAVSCCGIHTATSAHKWRCACHGTWGSRAAEPGKTPETTPGPSPRGGWRSAPSG